MQSKCLELEETRRAERTRMQSSCLELKERESRGNKDADEILRVRRRDDGLGGRAAARSKKREEELMDQGCRAVA